MHWASPTRPAPAESPRAGRQQGYVVVAVRCRALAFFCMETKKKVIVISGASSGIGKAIATHMADLGHIVYGSSRNPLQNDHPEGYTLLHLDVTIDSSVREFIHAIQAKEGRIDVLINNAGKGMTGPVEEIPLAEVQALFDLNYFGALRMIQEVLPIMRSQKSGWIINISSIAGYMGLPYRAHYSAVKAALSTLTEGMRLELKPFGIEMVNLAPGDFATNIASGRYHAPLVKDSAYFEVYKEQLQQFDDHVHSGASPKAVALFIEGLFNKTSTKPHYFVASTLQKFSASVLKKILPQRWFERMLAKHYNLPL